MQYGKLFCDNIPFNKTHWLIWLIKAVLKLNKNEHTLGKYLWFPACATMIKVI